MRSTNAIRRLKRVVAFTVGAGLLLVALLSAFVTATSALPQGSTYAHRRTITIDHAKVPNTDQSNFPVLISGTYSYLATVSNGGNVQHGNGYDVIFSSDGGCVTKLDHEVESYNGTTGAVSYWVRVSLLSHVNDTTIYLCYGNAAITTDQSNKSGVWDSNFKAVYHLNDQAANTTVTDATANGNNGLNAANTSGKSVSGKLARALSYNGSSDQTATGVAQTNSFTWECWFKLTDWTTQSGSSNYATLLAANYANGGALLMLWKDSAWTTQFASDNVGGVTSGPNSVALGTWHHVAYTRSGNNGYYALYFNGEFKGQVTSGTTNTTGTISLGTRVDYTPQALNGWLDETRLSNVARSADWIKTQYNNQSSPATFYSISASTNCCDTATARLDPLNHTGGSGENPLSRNFNWTLPLVALPGRAGLDLSLKLSYNSLVWTKSGSYISFDDDRGFPGPGFRLGFPVIQPQYFNAEVGKYGFLLIGSDGSRTELRRVGTSTLYESADSSYLLLDASTMVLRTTDGTQLKYELKGSDFQCTEIKDRNGNYITINYTTSGRIDTVIDTLGRSIKFNYDANGWLTSITQIWNQNQPSQVTHNWATFDYTNTTIQTNFTGLTLNGPSNGSTIKTVSKVTLADSSHFDFSYTSWGQVWKVSSFAADNHLLNYRSYNLPQTATAQTDCPRFTERRDWAENWNQNVSGVEQEAITTFAEPASETSPLIGGGSLIGIRAHVTAPDLTSTKIFFIDPAGTTTDWQRGLPALVNTYDSSGTLQRQVKTTWTQNNTSVSYPDNPRVTETNTYDPAGNRARVQLTYQQFTFANGTGCQLPRDTYEYAANASTILRSTRTDYHTGTAYTDRRIIGLVTERRLYDGDVNGSGVLMSKTGIYYDNENSSTSIQGTDAPIQHDNTNYTANFVTGRANLSSVRRYNVTNIAQFTTTRNKFNTAGAILSTTDASNHTAQVSYGDSFSDGNNSRNTLAYPTTLTDPDNYTSTAKYNFDFGAVTYKRTPQPNTTQNQPGPEQTITYDQLGRVQQVTNQVNGAYTRFVYPNTMTRVDTYATLQDSLGEAYSAQYADGAGRVIANATQHPGSVGGYSGQKFVYDVMGRRIKTSNPTETSASGAPAQWAAAGDDAATGWIYTQQSYDWKGRPLVTTNQDGTTKTASYAGCGCAGGEVVTLTDEGTLNGGVARKRQQKVYSDVLGRTVKTETLNWENGSVYAATVQAYNVLDQVTLTRQFAGAEGSATYQDTTMSYDGYGRLSSQHVPEQIGATTWAYNADDTAQSVTDARGAITTFTYNARHLPTGMTHTLGSEVLTQSFSYDAARNRTSMTDPSGSTFYHFTAFSQIDSETRTFLGLGGSYTLTYEYTLTGQLKNLTDHTNQRVNYSYDEVGRLNNIVGTNYSANQFITSIKARAWGDSSEIIYGNGLKATFNYNNRLQTEHFQLTTSGGTNRLSRDYEYHQDGSIRYSQNLLDAVLDRSFEYDHVGRLTKAFSGAEARGEPATTNRPYKETATYDEFDHLKIRSSLHWSRVLGFGSSDTYVNNRRVNWTYDANGNWLSNGQRSQAYDAAGRTKSITWSTGDQFTQSYDADGRRVKTVDDNITTYYLRSTVLNGQVIEELNASGTKEKGFIYAGEKMIAHHGTNGNLILEHEDPSGLSVRTSTPGSDVTGYWAELDPWGAEVLASDPYLADPQFSGGRGEGGSPVFPGFGDISMPSLGCTQMLDGVLSLCDFIERNRNGGGIQQERLLRNGKVQRRTIDMVLGITRVWHPASDDPLDELNALVPGYWELLDEPPVDEKDLKAQRARIARMLQDKRCAQFIERLLNEVKRITGQDYGDVLTTFDKINFYWKELPPSTGGEAVIRNKEKAAVISDRVKTERFISSDRTAFLDRSTTQSFLAETLHHTSTVTRPFTDGVFAQALNNLLVQDKLDVARTFDPRDTTSAAVDASGKYWHYRVDNNCPVPKR